MEHEMRETFDALRAPEEVKDRTRAAVARQVRRRKRLRPLMAVACFAVVVVTLGGWRAYFTPAAVISVDINPSVELEVNRFDRVLSLEGLGDDGEALAAALNVRFLDYRTALEEILSSGAVTECLAQGEELSIAVVDLTGNGSGELLSGVEACAAATPGAHCYAADYGDVSDAHSCGLSYGKYSAYLALRALDPTVTAKEVQGMTMREIRARIAALGGDDSDVPAGSQETGQGAGAGHGQEHGRGHHGGC